MRYEDVARKIIQALVLAATLAMSTYGAGYVRCNGKVSFSVSMRYIPYTPRVPPDDLNPYTGYSPLLCVVHDHRFALWKHGSLLPSGLVRIIRYRDYSEVIGYLSKFRDDNGSVYNWTTSSIIDEKTAQTKVNVGGDSVIITADGARNATWVACFVALIPSPDWFLGFESIDLCQANDAENSFGFVSPQLKRKLRYQYDAGVDSQEYVGFQPQLQDPPSVVRIRTELWTDRQGDYVITNMDATSTPTPAETKLECFPAGSRVKISDGRVVQVEDLRPGDLVDGGYGMATSVYMVSHADGKVEAQFVRAHFEDGGCLTASGGHYVPTYDSGILAMDELQIGTRLLLDTGTTRVVERVELVRALGLYNPHTLSGNLVVDGTLVTTYTRSLAPRTAHGILAFPRALHKCGFGTLVARIAQKLLGTGLLNAYLARMVPTRWIR